MEQFDLDAFLPYQLAVAATRVSRAFAERYRAEFGLSIPEWRVLAHLSRSGAVSVREIEARVDMDKSKVSRAAARLVTAGLVTKRANPADRRLVELDLSESGRDIVSRIAPIARAFQADMLAALGPAAPAFHAGLAALAAAHSATGADDGDGDGDAGVSRDAT